MRTRAILLALLAPAVLVCADAPAPASDAVAAASAGGVPLAGYPTEDPQDTTQLVVRRVWTGPGASPLGGLTPDGRYVTFVDLPRNDLALRDMQTGDVRYLTDRRVGDPEGAYPNESIVSPDGKRVAYHWYPGGWIWEMHVVDIDGSNRATLLEGVEGWAEPTDWTPDGEEILVGLQREDDGPFALALVSASDGSIRVLKEFSPRVRGDARFSPDGRYVVYDVEVDGESQRDIFILSVDGGREHTLVEHPAHDYVLGWVPGTDYLLFASDRTGANGAWILPVTDGRPAGPPTLVKHDLWGALPMGFTADGAFYYGVKVSTRGVHLATIDPETKRMLSEPTPIDPRQIGNSQRPRWSPDGRYLSYLMRNGASGGSVAIRSMETGETRHIEPKVWGSCPARWSPDGRYFLFCGRDANRRRGLFKVDVQTGETVPLKLFENNGASFWTDWAPDGKSIYYRVDYGEESRIEALDIETGAERTLRIADEPNWIVMVYVDVSSDGEELAFWEWGDEKAHLLVIPTSPGEADAPPRELLEVDRGADADPEVGYVRWSRDGRYVMYQVGEGDSARLWRVPTEGGDPEPLELILGEYPQFSPDGRRIAFDWGESAWEVWVMENYLPRR